MFLSSSRIFQRFCLLVAVTGSISCANAATFTDDLGVEHEFPDDRPAKIVVSSYSARGLRHFGLTADQVAATYHERNVVGSGVEDMDPTGYDGAVFPSNPSEEELLFFAEIEDLSTACGPTISCQTIDMDLFTSLAPSVDFVIMEGFRHEVGLFGSYVQQIEEVMGKPIILIDVSLEGPDCVPDAADRCYGKSFIDITKQMEELAAFLKYTPPPTLEEDKQLLCQVSQEFQEIASGAHERGVRVMAAYLGTQNLIPVPPPYINYFANPPDDNVLRMLEELGMPLMHPYCSNPSEEEVCPFDGYYWETVLTQRYFGNCNSTQPADLARCSDDVIYPVDMWLYDQRSTQWVSNPAFADVFPDKAIAARQIAYWPIGGTHAVSYRFAAEILQEIGPVLDQAKRMHPATDCTVADVNGVAHRTVGLPQGAYACYDANYHNKEYLTCPTDPPTDAPVVATPIEADNTADEDDGLGAGFIAGIVVGGIAFVVILVGSLSYVNSRSGTDFDTMEPTIQKVRDAEGGGDIASEGQSSAMGTDSTNV